jgi:[acyl-carrier-protein] S-malonyltransferase
MGRDLFDQIPEVRDLFETASKLSDIDIVRVCFEGPKEVLDKTHITQPCLLTVEVALFEALRSRGIKPSIVAGHSLGEYSALVAQALSASATQ